MPIDEEPGIITQHSPFARRTDVAGMEPKNARRDLFARRGAMVKSVRQLVLWQSHVEPAIGDIDLYDVPIPDGGQQATNGGLGAKIAHARASRGAGEAAIGYHGN